MRCPYCLTPLKAEAASCPVCNLSFSRTSQLLGAVPRLSPLVSDTTGLLAVPDQNRIKRALVDLRHRFPQVVIQVVMHTFPLDHPFRLHVFWLFNAAPFSGGVLRGKENRSILLAIDPARKEAALMPGYGLEDLLGPDALDLILVDAEEKFRDGSWAEGMLQVVEDLGKLLQSVAPEQVQAPLEDY